MDPIGGLTKGVEDCFRHFNCVSSEEVFQSELERLTKEAVRARGYRF